LLAFRRVTRFTFRNRGFADHPPGMKIHPDKAPATTIRRVGILLISVLLAVPPARAEPNDAIDLALLALLNHARANVGQPPLVMAPALQEMARDWSVQQLREERLSHRPIEHQQAWIEKHFTPHWRAVGENVGMGPSVASVYRTFMLSEKHRQNALGDFTHVGVGAIPDTTGRIWVTMNFVAAPNRISTSPPSPSAPARSAIVTGGLRALPTP